MEINIDVQQPEIPSLIELDISTGVSYSILDNKPQINGVELVGNKTIDDLGLQPKGDYVLRSELPSGGDFVEKDELARVAFSGNYNDLTNKPTIPSVPTKTSQLVNDSGFLTQHQDISGKQDKLIAGDNITISGNVISSTGGVSDVYTKVETNNLLNNKQDKGNYALKSELPTKTSQLTNDSGFLTQHQDISQLATKAELNSKQDKGDYALQSQIPDVSNFATKEYAVKASFPSSRYTDLTLGDSETEYIAVADGYFYIDKASGGDGKYVRLNNTSKNISIIGVGHSSAIYITILLPVLKNDVVSVKYNATGTTRNFKFIYAEGAE